MPCHLYFFSIKFRFVKHIQSGVTYLLSSLAMRFDTGADRIVLWVRLAYAREYVIQHYAYAPVSKRIARELS